MKRVGAALLLFSLAVPLGALSAEGAELDPVVTEVLHLLEAGVSEGLVQKWLETTGQIPRELGSDDVIALTRAGASEDLIAWLLELAAGAGERLSAELPQPLPGPSSEEPPPAGIPAAAAHGEATGEVEVDFTLGYRPQVEEDDEPWDLFVYLDGAFLARVPARGGSQVTSSRGLASGSHRLVVALERHEKRSGRKREWFHQARVSPEPLDVELPRTGQIDLELTFREPWLERPDRGPLFLRLSADGRELDRRENAGRAADDWPPLCEEVEANLLPDRKVPAAARRALKRCLRWSDLWGEGAGVADRDAIRRQLAESGS
jgi:hypothetical protein